MSSSKKLVKWDIIFSRCYQYKRRFYSTGTLTIFNLAEKEYILERINSEYAKYKEQNEEKNYAAFAKNNWEFFFKIEREIFKPEKDKKFYSNHGVLQLYEIRFQVNDLQTALSKIREPEEFNFTGSAIRKLKKNVLSATSLNGWQWVLKQN